MPARGFHPVLSAAACAALAFGASAAPELLANGGGEQPVQAGWTILQGAVRTTGLIRSDAGDFFAPDHGLGFIVLGPGEPASAVQAGSFPLGSERLFLKARLRTPANATAAIILRAFDSSGALDLETTLAVPTSDTWTSVQLTYAIPPGSRTWQLELRADQPGSFGVHADAMTLIGTCGVDFNGDRLANFFDVAAYLALFTAGDPAADLTRNGKIDFFDISELLDSFLFGCE